MSGVRETDAACGEILECVRDKVMTGFAEVKIEYTRSTTYLLHHYTVCLIAHR